MLHNRTRCRWSSAAAGSCLDVCRCDSASRPRAAHRRQVYLSLTRCTGFSTERQVVPRRLCCKAATWLRIDILLVPGAGLPLRRCQASPRCFFCAAPLHMPAGAAVLLMKRAEPGWVESGSQQKSMQAAAASDWASREHPPSGLSRASWHTALQRCGHRCGPQERGAAAAGAEAVAPRLGLKAVRLTPLQPAQSPQWRGHHNRSASNGLEAGPVHKLCFLSR